MENMHYETFKQLLNKRHNLMKELYGNDFCEKPEAKNFVDYVINNFKENNTPKTKVQK